LEVLTAKATGPRATEPVPTFPVEVRDGDIYVNLENNA
jgi:hypothetical protein